MKSPWKKIELRSLKTRRTTGESSSVISQQGLRYVFGAVNQFWQRSCFLFKYDIHSNRNTPDKTQGIIGVYNDGLVQDYSNSIANALELLQYCIKQSIWCLSVTYILHHKTYILHHKCMSYVDFSIDLPRNDNWFSETFTWQWVDFAATNLIKHSASLI